MSKIWVIADTHYGHNNISNKHTSQWKQGWRDFDNLEQMNETIVKNINKLVSYDDILYHLGDWSFGGIQNIWNFRKQINCKTIHLCLGNHDEHIKKNKVLLNVEGWGDNITKLAQELFTSVQDTLHVSHGKHSFFMSHYAHRVWYGNHKGVIHLYGHSHSSLEKSQWGKSMDVGIDNAKKLLGEYRPFSIEEVIQLMSKREIFFPDHHNAETNIK